MTWVRSNLVKINWFSTEPKCPRGWAVSSDTDVDGSSLTEDVSWIPRLGEPKKLPGGEFLCQDAQDDAYSGEFLEKVWNYSVESSEHQG